MMKLSDATDFRKAYQREFSIAKKTGVFDGIEDRLEKMAVTVFGEAKSEDDDFAPPAKPITVKCRHCGETYSSDKMQLAYRPQFQHPTVAYLLGKEVEKLTPMWWCKNLRCDGAWFGFDIHAAGDQLSNRAKSSVKLGL
jgi:hypothetical protein